MCSTYTAIATTTSATTALGLRNRSSPSGIAVCAIVRNTGSLIEMDCRSIT